MATVPVVPYTVDPPLSRSSESDHLAQRLLQAQETERRRIAAELHDGINQQVALLTMEIGLIIRDLPAGETKLKERLQTLRKRTVLVAEEIRAVSHRLHPSVLEHLGLVAVLRNLCADVSESAGIWAHFVADCPADSLSLDGATALYRIAQAAIQNVNRHTEATEVNVCLEQRDNMIILSVEDNGAGIDISRLASTTGIGMATMRERASGLGGWFQVNRIAPRGTRIEAAIPLCKERTGSKA